MSTEAESQGLNTKAKIVLAIFAALILAAIVWRGPTFEGWDRVWNNLTGRVVGPMKFRLFLQPTMALIAAIRDGIKDARTGRSPYFFTVLSRPQERMARVNEGLVSTGRTIMLSLIVDAIYQLKVFKTFYPGEALATAILLAFVPYVLLRGPIARIARLLGARKTSGAAA